MIAAKMRGSPIRTLFFAWQFFLDGDGTRGTSNVE